MPSCASCGKVPACIFKRLENDLQVVLDAMMDLAEECLRAARAEDKACMACWRSWMRLVTGRHPSPIPASPTSHRPYTRLRLPTCALSRVLIVCRSGDRNTEGGSSGVLRRVASHAIGVAAETANQAHGALPAEILDGRNLGSNGGQETPAGGLPGIRYFARPERGTCNQMGGRSSGLRGIGYASG